MNGSQVHLLVQEVNPRPSPLLFNIWTNRTINPIVGDIVNFPMVTIDLPFTISYSNALYLNINDCSRHNLASNCNKAISTNKSNSDSISRWTCTCIGLEI